MFTTPGQPPTAVMNFFGRLISDNFGFGQVRRGRHITLCTPYVRMIYVHS